MNDLTKLEEKIKALQSKMNELKKKEEKRKLHYLITIIKSTVLDNFHTADLETIATFLKNSSKNKTLNALMKDVNKSFVELFENIKRAKN